MQWTIYAKLNLDDIWHRFCWGSFKANYGIIWEFPPNGRPIPPFGNPLFNCLLLEIGGPTTHQGKNSLLSWIFPVENDGDIKSNEL